ncbi:hypothetical protein K9U34_06090 [Lawsonia intracellularis]|uniref:NA n=2 Tax=Lawsonia intracellularis TaxID=29546 RepID=Q1MSE0_LAWIP|nr:hypothetical protein LAW_00028 [Lawsonia intracellularis N343]KAA0204944.1 hypothetical protein C4K43_00325 [Lawsonia intracellularis]CAJ54085.1 NA [Lawsonia intracellularis PHE/MN1-00]MBZ3893163.1 hypothetical protein [Lawsonia intracellularis]RBN32507.1 hypothetical protein DR194_06050 [Lawsonia intracellularis]
MDTIMLIRNSTELFTAMLDRKTIILGDEGELQTKEKTLGSRLKPQPARVAPELTAKQSEAVQLSMAKLVEYEARSSFGRANLPYPMPLGGKSYEETLHKARLTLGNKMIEFVAEKELKDEPKAIRQGVIPYLQALWQEEHPEGPIDIYEIQTIVKDILTELKKDPGKPLSQLAYGFILGPTELQEHMLYLEQKIGRAIELTWDDKHQHEFDENGIYDIFTRDAPRDRPYFQNVKLSYEKYSNEDALEKYKEMLIKEFPERSIAAVVGICMSQTIMADFSAMIMNVNTPFPLNPYCEKNSQDISRIMTLVTSNTDPLPEETLDEELDEDLKVQEIPLRGAEGGGQLQELPREEKPTAFTTSEQVELAEEAEESSSEEEPSTSSVTRKPLSLREQLIKTARTRTSRTMLFNQEGYVLIIRNFGISLRDTTTGFYQQVGSTSFMLQIPKDQFPLAVGAKPVVKVVDMQVERKTPFVGHHALQKGFIGQVIPGPVLMSEELKKK